MSLNSKESNTFEVKLKKPSVERVLIVGEVTDQNGKDVEGATVEFKLVNILKETKTDVSGNYMIEIDLNELKVSSSEGELEVKKRDCKVKEKILVGQKSILKDLKLDCQKKPTEAIKEPEKQPERTTSSPGSGRGHICIKNLTKVSIIIFVHNKETKAEVGRLSLDYRQQEEKCVYNLKPGVYYYVGGDYGIYTGEVLVEAGKTETVRIR